MYNILFKLPVYAHHPHFVTSSAGVPQSMCDVDHIDELLTCIQDRMDEILGHGWSKVFDGTQGE